MPLHFSGKISPGTDKRITGSQMMHAKRKSLVAKMIKKLNFFKKEVAILTKHHALIRLPL